MPKTDARVFQPSVCFVAVNGYESVVEPTEAVETIFGIAEGNLPESQLAVGIRSHTKHER